MERWRIQRNAGQPHHGGLQEAEGALVTQRPRSSHPPSFYTKHECWLLFFPLLLSTERGREGGKGRRWNKTTREGGGKSADKDMLLSARRPAGMYVVGVSVHVPPPPSCSRQINLRALITADLEDTRVIKSNTSTNACWEKPAAIVSH